MSISTIKPAEFQDFDDIFWLLQQKWSNKKMDEDAFKSIFMSEMNSIWSEYFCALHEGNIIGFCSIKILKSFQAEGHIAYLQDFIIQSAYKDLGIDNEMLKAVVVTAKNKGCKKIELNSDLHTKRSKKFYENNGFTKIAYIYSKEI